MTEHVLQRLILAHLAELPECFFWQSNVGAGRRADGQWITFGRKGQSDILGCAKGRFCAIEVKSDSGRLSPEQQEFGDAVTRSGGLYIVARTLEDAFDPVRELVGMVTP